MRAAISGGTRHRRYKNVTSALVENEEEHAKYLQTPLGGILKSGSVGGPSISTLSQKIGIFLSTPLKHPQCNPTKGLGQCCSIARPKKRSECG